ncbi:MAG: BMP family lipoprotein [Brevinema sp.]
MRIFILFFVFVMSACAQDANNKGDKARIAYLISGSLGDKGYYDNGQRGIDRLKEEYGAETLTVEIGNDPSRYQSSLELVTQWNPDLVFVIPHGFESLLKEYADNYTNIEWVSLSIPMQSEKTNLSSFEFYVSQGSFLAGILAALMTTDTSIKNINPEAKVGIIAGMKNPTMMKDFVDPFRQGARYVNPNIVVQELYTETFADPTRGKQAATQLYKEGVDVIYQAAGLTGLGVLEAAKENNAYGIGVDINQNALYPGFVVSSVLVDYGNAITAFYKKLLAKEVTRGSVYRFGVKDEIITLAIDEHTTAILSPEILARLDEYISLIKQDKLAQDLK